MTARSGVPQWCGREKRKPDRAGINRCPTLTKGSKTRFMDNSFNPSAEILFEEAPQQKFPWVNVALFGLTCLSTMVMGCLLTALFTNTFRDLGSFSREILMSPSSLVKGIPFSLAIMTILLA